MIDYATTNPGDRLRITGMGAPGFANLGDIVEVVECTPVNHGRCKVRHLRTGDTAEFVLTCGAQRLEHIYRDSDGRPCSLDVLCRREPAWAANRIRTLTEAARRLLDLPDDAGVLFKSEQHDGGTAYLVDGIHEDWAELVANLRKALGAT